MLAGEDKKFRPYLIAALPSENQDRKCHTKRDHLSAHCWCSAWWGLSARAWSCCDWSSADCGRFICGGQL